jgi:hypothetical protein
MPIWDLAHTGTAGNRGIGENLGESSQKEKQSYNQKLWTAPTTQAAFLIPSTNTMPSTNSCSFALPFSFRQLFWAF